MSSVALIFSSASTRSAVWGLTKVRYFSSETNWSICWCCCRNFLPKSEIWLRPDGFLDKAKRSYIIFWCLFMPKIWGFTALYVSSVNDCEARRQEFCSVNFLANLSRRLAWSKALFSLRKWKATWLIWVKAISFYPSESYSSAFFVPMWKNLPLSLLLFGCLIFIKRHKKKGLENWTTKNA